VSIQSKGTKHDRQNRLRLSVAEGGR